eukprot:jgi/Mesen1/10343/ME000008S10128
MRSNPLSFQHADCLFEALLSIMLAARHGKSRQINFFHFHTIYTYVQTCRRQVEAQTPKRNTQHADSSACRSTTAPAGLHASARARAPLHPRQPAQARGQRAPPRAPLGRACRPAPNASAPSPPAADS